MLKETINQITVAAIWDVRQKKADDTRPIRIQVYHQGKQKYYNTGKSLTSEDWGRLFNSRQSELVAIRNTIKESFDLILRSVKELAADGAFSFENLEIRLGRASTGNLLDGFKVKAETLRRESRIGSMDYYDCTSISIEKFAGKSVPYEKVTVDWLKQYEKWMLAQGLSHTTVRMRMIAIRTIMNEAVRGNRIRQSQYPFGRGKYEIRRVATIKKALTLSQIAQIAQYDDGRLDTERWRDIWLFIYLCNGINMADLVNLKYKNITDGEICFMREKTKNTSTEIKVIRVTLMPEMERIISKWGNPRQPENRIFNLIRVFDDPIKHHKEVAQAVKNVNDRMNEIGAALGIGRITTYTARHSFATVLKRSGANIAYISESLGHASINTTRAYLDTFEKEERSKNAEILMSYLNQAAN